MKTNARSWTMVLTAGLSVVAAGCSEGILRPEEQVSLHRASESTAAAGLHAPPPISRAALGAWMRNLRQATRPFRRLDMARAAGYDARLTDCMESTAGGMGVHWGDLSLFDGVVEERKPEILLYEPLPSGRKRLVAVEYACTAM